MLSQKGSITFNDILKQPEVWQYTLDLLAASRADLQNWLRTEQFGQFLFVGCGSSLNVGIIGARTIHMITGLNAWSWPASEILLCARPPYDRRIKTLIILLSRSGETTETLWALQRLQQLDPRASILSITCKPGNPLLGMSHKSIVLEKAMDESQVPTRSVTASVLAVQMLAAWLLPDDRFVEELKKIPALVNLDGRKAELQKLTKDKPTHSVFAGHGPFYGVAAEGALKMKQMCMTSAEVVYPLEMRHGLWSGVNPGTTLYFFMSETLKTLEDDIIWEVAKLQGPRCAFTEAGSNRLNSGTEHVVELKSGLSECARVLHMLAYMQTVCFYISIAKGVNPDKPKYVPQVVKIKVGS